MRRVAVPARPAAGVRRLPQVRCAEQAFAFPSGGRIGLLTRALKRTARRSFASAGVRFEARPRDAPPPLAGSGARWRVLRTDAGRSQARRAERSRGTRRSAVRCFEMRCREWSAARTAAQPRSAPRAVPAPCSASAGERSSASRPAAPRSLAPAGLLPLPSRGVAPPRRSWAGERWLPGQPGALLRLGRRTPCAPVQQARCNGPDRQDCNAARRAA